MNEENENFRMHMRTIGRPAYEEQCNNFARKYLQGLVHGHPFQHVRVTQWVRRGDHNSPAQAAELAHC